MKIHFLGGAKTVTGSRFLVETQARRALVDCGLFQGMKQLRLLNWAPFPVPPSSVDEVLLTHAHLDHSGYLPAFVKQGFRGKVTTTAATAALAEILLADAARLEEEQARYARKKGFSKHDPPLPLFTEEDAGEALRRFHAVPFHADVDVGGGLRARFVPAGHILGAASIRISDGYTSVLFSGDLGRAHDPLMRPPEAPPAADILVVESTYGGRKHASHDARDALADVIVRTMKRGGVLMIPSFAVGRAQTLLHLIRALKDEQRIADVPVYLNSPMAESVLDVYCEHRALHRLDDGACRAMCEGARRVASSDESRELNTGRGPMIVVAGSGMATGGRILHHLKAWGGDSRNTILLVGFQAAGTRGDALAHGARSLRIHGLDVSIRAEVVELDALSGHADEDELLAWMRALPKAPRATYVVHGEPAAQEALVARVERELGWECHIPAPLDVVTV